MLQTINKHKTALITLHRVLWWYTVHGLYQMVIILIYGSFEMNYTNKSLAKSEYIVL